MMDLERTRETERRRATVLFADLTGFTALGERLDPEDAYQLVTDCLKLLDGIARRHGASVDKYLGDCIMATFGVPLAIENAARAAVNAAIEIRSAVRSFNLERRVTPALDIHSGINTGLLISGDISGPVIREFAVMGDAVNVAARLKDLAPPGEIWIGEETWRYVRHDFELEAIAPLELKGRQQRVAAYAVRSDRSSMHRPRAGERSPVWSPLVGRDAEMDRLRGRLRDLAAGQGGAVALAGEAGLGKSRLAVEAATCEEATACRWLEGRCLSVGGHSSFHPFRDLIRRSLEIADADDDATARGKLREGLAPLLGERLDDVTPFLVSLLGIHLSAPDRKRLAGISAEGLEQLTVGAITHVLEALAQDRPLVLAFEDIHWADESSLLLLESLLPVASRRPILILVLTRPDYPATSGRLLRAMAETLGDRFEKISLEPLPASVSERLLAHIFDLASLPAATLADIERKTAGNPFFVEEVARSLLDSGALVRREGRLAATERIRSLEIPATVEEVVLARIDRLETAPRAVLQAASVLGQIARRDVLTVLCEHEDLDSALDRLVELQFLERNERRDEGSVCFHHAILREVCYETMTRAKRQGLHLRAAHAIEAHVPETTPGFAGMLALHFGHAGDLESAEEYLLRAGEEAARIAAASEALQFFREASQLYLAQTREVEPGKHARLERNIALAHFHRGDLEEAVRHFNETLRLLGARVPASGLQLWTQTGRTLGSVFLRLYLPLFRGARPPATPRDHEVIELMFQRARAQVTTAPIRFFTDTIENMREVWRVDPATVPGAGGLFAGSAGLFAYAGWFSLSRRFLATAREFLDPEDVGERMTFDLHRFVYFYLSGDQAEAGEVARERIEEAVARGRLWDVCTYLGLFVKWLIYRGEYARAEEWIEYLVKLEESYSYATARETHQGVRATLLLERGRLDEALLACRRYFEANREILPNVLAFGLEAKALVELERLEDADRALARAEELVRGSRSVPAFHHSACLRSRLLLEVTRLEHELAAGKRPGLRARRRLLGVARRAERSSQGVAMRGPEVQRLAARLDWLLGRRRAARRRWEAGLALAERLGARPERARLHAEIALRAGAEGVAGRTAEEHLELARRELRALDLQRDLAALPGAR